MQGLKDLVSVKATDRRLPPLTRASSTLAGNNAPLPSISGSIQTSNAPLPGISDPVQSKLLPDMNKNSNLDYPQNEQPSHPRDTTKDSSLAKPTGNLPDASSTPMRDRNGHSATPVAVNSPAAALFQTSTTRVETHHDSFTAARTAVFSLNAAKEVRIK